MNRKTNLILGSLAVAFGIYIIIRAWLIPVTVDESSTAISHVPRSVFDTLFFVSDANPNNHILNTLLIKAFTWLFGWHPFVFRIPAVLGGMAYAFAGLLICRQISAQLWVRVFAYAILLGQPFLLEFFSLARGYSLGLGLMLCAIWQAGRFLNENRKESLLPAVIFSGLAVYANFTQMLFFAPFTALLFFCVWQESPSVAGFWSKSKAAILALGVFAGMLYTPLSRLSQHSELKNWQALGSFFDSIQISIRAATHGNAYLGKSTDLLLTWFVVTFTVGICAVGIWKSSRLLGRFTADPRMFLVALLVGVVVTNILQVQLTHTPYLQARLALHYWPLFAFALASAASWLWEWSSRRAWVFMTPVLVLAFVNIVRNADIRKTSEWWHDEFTYLVFGYLQKAQQAESRTEPFTIDTHWLLQNSLMYHHDLDPRGFNHIAKLSPWHELRAPNPEFEFYYALNAEDANKIMDTHEVVMTVPNNSMTLLRRKKPSGQ
jgi:hypothetical protein